MTPNDLGIMLIAGFLLVIGSLVFLASRKGWAAEAVLSISVLLSGVLACGGIWNLFDHAETNDTQGMIIASTGILAVLISGTVYAKALRRNMEK
jgi:hypothetical protein